MSEEQFQVQEQARLRVEERKQALREGKPLTGTVDEFLQVFKEKLQEDPLLLKYITREHAENKEFIELLQRQYERRLSEQTNIISGLEQEIASLRGDMNEFKDNFNLALNKLLVLQQAHKERVDATCRLIELEIGS